MNYFPIFRNFRDSLAPIHRDRRPRAAGTSADIPPEYFDYLIASSLVSPFRRADLFGKGKSAFVIIVAIINVLFIKYYLTRNGI